MNTFSNLTEQVRDAGEKLLAIYDAELGDNIGGNISGRPVVGDAFLAYQGLLQARDLCHGLAHRSGWWTDLGTDLPIDPEAVFAEKLLLVHGEISEAMEGHRKSLPDDHLPHRHSLEVELADAMIRILDLAGAMDLDLAGALIEKLAYNQERADHKKDNRRSENGKRY